ncbi:hypothetical protein SEA_ENGINEER_125 [Gordonia Phage Engineer]|nr:hypothetical protein SEA_ENGINEER_125 [Gordonia Phage Engineer]
MFAKFEVREESETVEVTGAAAVGRFRDGYYVTENLVYRRITVAVWFDSEPEQGRLAYVMTLDAGGGPEIVFDRLIVKTPNDVFASPPAWWVSGPAVQYLEALNRDAPTADWVKVPAALISAEIRELKERY